MIKIHSDGTCSNMKIFANDVEITNCVQAFDYSLESGGLGVLTLKIVPGETQLIFDRVLKGAEVSLDLPNEIVEVKMSPKLTV